MTQASALNPYKKAAKAQKEMQTSGDYSPAEEGRHNQPASLDQNVSHRNATVNAAETDCFH